MIILPSPRQHNEFSFENQTVSYWDNGYIVAELKILKDEFEDYTCEGMTEADAIEMYNDMINFYKTL